MNGETEAMRKHIEKVNAERAKIRAAVVAAIGPITNHEMAKHYGTSRATMKRILDDEVVGASSGRKAKVRSSSEAIAMINDDYQPKSKADYIAAITAVIQSLKI